ncbi:RIKEN cDNA 2900001O04, isoform CRA_b [Mus musculus]|uniref:Isoform 2 of Tetratricopeptide repeat protein 33 n=1 Tax=Mus musculus TaxID=10090 RepID=Q9D6K7-2|nr:Ttc33 protein [Mus musculus]EDL03379.1 RIKEN cDNA 2900001O04, isoform CRA_b [Mus musculus]
MASFGWKRRIGEKVSKATSQQFEAEAADEKDAAENEDGNWLQASKRRKETLQEGCKQRSQQLKDEGAQLAENKRSCCLFMKCFQQSMQQRWLSSVTHTRGRRGKL